MCWQRGGRHGAHVRQNSCRAVAVHGLNSRCRGCRGSRRNRGNDSGGPGKVTATQRLRGAGKQESARWSVGRLLRDRRENKIAHRLGDRDRELGRGIVDLRHGDGNLRLTREGSTAGESLVGDDAE